MGDTVEWKSKKYFPGPWCNYFGGFEKFQLEAPNIVGWMVHWLQMGLLFQVQNKIYGGEFAFQRQKSTSSLSRIMISVHQNQPSSSKLLLTLVMRYLSQVYLSRRWQGVKISTSSRTFYWLKKTFLKNGQKKKRLKFQILRNIMKLLFLTPVKTMILVVYLMYPINWFAF